ncbi:MAG: DUF4198 domain-containing protein [Pseudomonadota bacterium]
MARIVPAIVSALCLSGQASAHDFWLRADPAPDEGPGCYEVRTEIGHGAERQAWPLVSTRLSALRHFAKDGTITDLQPEIGAGRDEGLVSVCMDGAEDGIFAIEGFRSFSELEAERFQSYITNEGIRPLIVHRQVNGLTDTPGRELYSRASKAMPAGAASDAVSTRALGLILEITPLLPPGQLQAGETLPLKVTYRGEPVANAMIHVTALNAPDLEVEPLLTGPDGVTDFLVAAPAHWMFHTVWGEASSSLIMDADYATVFSSLTVRIGE